MADTRDNSSDRKGENKRNTPPAAGAVNKGTDGRRDKVTPQDPHANLSTTSRGADSTDKEFRNDQPNASTLKSHKSSADINKKK
ncbi:hypothetical protein [Pontibacter mangrovi]|uniref:Uncharacterized protein n=1 Tax=Pontibacter mangrovi TaxID=2589816 RepID=A0A501VZW6_9BACT|nr:hypothetical protein [Pontibacter mangrovi]TPE42969.1 hypothetical protein FJM65_15085 [Pontibacter mangrovi]